MTNEIALPDEKTLYVNKIDTGSPIAEARKTMAGKATATDANFAGRGAKRKPLLPVTRYMKAMKDYAANWLGNKAEGLANPYSNALGKELSGMPDYLTVKELVRRYLHDMGTEGMSVKEVNLRELDKDGHLAEWKERDGKVHILIPRKGDFRDVFGSAYKSVLKMLNVKSRYETGQGMSEKELNHYAQKRVKLHEYMEATIRPKWSREHDMLDALEQYAMKDLAREGDMVAYKTYLASVGEYKVRESRGDSFARSVLGMNPALRYDVNALEACA